MAHRNEAPLLKPGLLLEGLWSINGPANDLMYLQHSTSISTYLASSFMTLTFYIKSSVRKENLIIMKPFPGGPGDPPPMHIPGVDFPITKAQPRYRDLAYASVSPAQK